MIERFSSSGLASARVDHLKARGVDAYVVFHPRSLRDATPFYVSMSPRRKQHADKAGREK